MSNLVNFTGKFRVQSNHGSSGSKVTKRPRSSTVCIQCRKNKLRCDRGQPCGNCVRRDQEAVCSYEPGPTSRHDPSRNAVAEDRLLHLEAMVKELMENQASAQLTNNSASALATPPELPASVMGNPEQPPAYAGSTHWSSILEDIHELKVVLSGTAYATQAEDREATGMLTPENEPIFGSPNSYSLQQIIDEYLPSKADLDRLLALFFRGRTFIVPFVHTYQFQRQYREFWQASPATCAPLWLSLLFSICFAGSLIEGPTSIGSPNNLGPVNDNLHLHVAAGKCLALGHYHRPQQHGPEALAMYAHCKNMKTMDPSRDAASILGMSIRIAYEMGYHRDAASLGSLSVFEGEMRRRFWATVTQMDLMMSFMLGLPSNIKLENCDTKSPRNLSDSDFDMDTKVLPPPRSEEESTRILWFIVKDGQIVHFSKVWHDALSFTEKTEDEVIRLDNDIRQMHTTIPKILRTRPLSESITEDPFLIVTRLYVDLMYFKSLCVLHRRYMARGNAFSTRVCIDAGKQIVSQVIDMYREFSPGGLLHSERWMLTNYTLNDFHLGVMILCLVLHIRGKKGSFAPAINDIAEKEVRALLEQSQAILREKSTASRDARRVSHAVRLSLDNATRRAVSSSSVLTPPPTTTAAASSMEPTSKIVDLVDSALPPLPSLQPEYLQPDEMDIGQLDPFNFMGNEFESFDWAIADPQIFGQDT